ncbi:alpha/beta fold hydrolase [Phytoactinopolyspora endophytica]|uniref:alpha/beta fold hydrolase n=1 Tax=Phytoactinopolyspora endophytica TaxID=1642495 RepID=UPI00101C9D8F|nr:alpha/beta hydrolase [Phytoactinopolyspora endophytica]
MNVRAADGSWKLQHHVQVSGGEVATGVWGDGPPVVLTHGTPAWSYLWRGVVPVLARRYRVYAWDLLGFGGSRLGPGAVPSIAEQSRTLAELIEHWGLNEPSLVGHDIGGGIVARAHLVEGVPVRRLALLDAAVLGPWNTPFTEHMQRHSDVYRTMPQHIFDDIITARLQTATHQPMPDAVARAYHAPWAGSAGQQRWIDQVAAVSFEDTRDVVARLDQISAPTLVLWGEQDEWLPPATGERLAGSIPGARLETIRAAGHFAPEDNPDDVADALSTFLA